MANDGPAILVVEDEPPIAELIAYTLRGNGWDVRVSGSTAEGWQALQESIPDLVLLDWMLPDQSGLRLLHRMRGDPHFRALPVIMLTARSMEEDKVAGLDNGADDYMTKPFSPREVVARVRVILRRRAPVATNANGVWFDVDEASARIRFCGTTLELTRYEFLLLKMLLSHAGRIYAREVLMDAIWRDALDTSDRTVDTHIKTLRAKLKA
ncbi:MAG: response regulator, partial [Lacisediminimonas sp.]|nr:response regulator [Lacisediminimonas sp.]